MGKFVFMLVFPFLLGGIQALINRKTVELTVKGDADVFCVEYPSILRYFGIFGIIFGAVIFVVAACDLGKPHWVLLLPLSFVVAGVFLLFKVLFWKIYVNNDSITILRPFRKPYSFSLEDIVSVKRECKDTYNGVSERMLIQTNRYDRICVESGASCYFLLRDKLRDRFEWPIISGF